MIKIVLDAFGGDNSPQANLDGAIKALQNIDDLHVTIVGDENIIKDYLGDKFDPARMAIVHAPDVISCDEKPTEAIKNKKDSSMARSFELLRSDPEIGGMVSTGSTGALLAGAVLRIGRIKGVKRPAFCPHFAHNKRRQSLYLRQRSQRRLRCCTPKSVCHNGKFVHAKSIRCEKSARCTTQHRGGKRKGRRT